MLPLTSSVFIYLPAFCSSTFVSSSAHVEWQILTFKPFSAEALAVIKGIDASEALKVSGVVAVLDAKDVPGENKSDVEEVFASKKVCISCWIAPPVTHMAPG